MLLAGLLLLGGCGSVGGTEPGRSTSPSGPATAAVEQPTAGEGWRLLGEGLTGEPYRTGVATTDDQLDALWRTAGLDDDPAEVDWEREIAVWFGAVYGSGCPVRLDGVVVADDLLHAELTLPGEPDACPDDANPHAFVVAVARDVLPDGPFHIQLEARDPYPGEPEERTLVDVGLTAPGSTATVEQLRPDPALAGPAEPLVADGDDLPGDRAVRYVYRADPACDTPVLGPLDGSLWRPADGEAPWDVADGTELTLYPLGGEGAPEMVASSPQTDWLLVRLDEGHGCP
ncbi:hypothetical protein SAMN05216184_11122 [Georgenia satyanarayanai]|uniref:Uncharacterized protein n=1 Tax=Georgenia satyanarayanai TaxID=860221 RepID=A0A2Y9ALP3_9MICO|nr:hypothetical protein A8987_11122 [Georgenia satyanarayanai]SSA44976.1 hypothetical protein SAMN05216184_11122 [Georgenia satyanarayanai]